LAETKHQKAAEKIRNVMGTYERSEDLIQIGAYKKGNSQEIDEAIEYYPKIMDFLRQEIHESVPKAESIGALIQLAEKGEC
jgi:flagellum-specific ATP synthase